MSVLCSLPFALSLFSACAPAPPLATGYIEGEFTLVAPVAVSQIARVAVKRGDRVEAGDILVEMTRRDAEIALAEAEAALAQATGFLADLKAGQRPEEIVVIEATLASARAQAAEAERVRERMTSLALSGAVTDARRDDADTAAAVAAARVAQVRAELAVARLPARPEAIAQAEASVSRAEAVRAQAVWNLDQRTLTLSEPVTVFDVIRTEGEIAGPSAPVLSVLADDAVKLRLYIPETFLAGISMEDVLMVGCNGCPETLKARITYISAQPEFTPPVIYSLQNRQKLVYLIEARPEDGATLKPGQIVDVWRPGPTP